MNSIITHGYPHPWLPGWKFQLDNHHSKKDMVFCSKCNILYFDIVDHVTDFVRGDTEGDLESIKEEIKSWK